MDFTMDHLRLAVVNTDTSSVLSALTSGMT